MEQPRHRPSPPPPRATRPRWVPYPFESLPRLSERQVEVTNRLLGLLPLAGAVDTPALQAVGDLLGELTRGRATAAFHGLRVYPGADLRPDLSDAFVTELWCPPQPEAALLTCDRALVEAMIARMLSDTERPPGRATPINEWEFGLMTYVVMRALQNLSRHGLAPLVVASAPPRPERILRELSGHRAITELVFVVAIEQLRGMVRLLLPGELVDHLEAFCEGDFVDHHRRQHQLRPPLAEVMLRFPVSLGRLPLTMTELFGLRPGDVLLPPSHGLELDGVDGGQDEGRLIVDDDHFLPCRLLPGDEGQWNLRILSNDPSQTPSRSDDMTQTNGSAGENISEEKTAHLDNLARMELDVRVGQASLTVAELARLQPGQVLTLENKVGRPVELIAAGRVVGLGELVNVEGRLGVRVVSVGAPRS